MLKNLHRINRLFNKNFLTRLYLSDSCSELCDSYRKRLQSYQSQCPSDLHSQSADSYRARSRFHHCRCPKTKKIKKNIKIKIPNRLLDRKHLPNHRCRCRSDLRWRCERNCLKRGMKNLKLKVEEMLKLPHASPTLSGSNSSVSAWSGLKMYTQLSWKTSNSQNHQ